MAKSDRGELPPFMATNAPEEIEVQEEVWYHNWLYSVNPGSKQVQAGWDSQNLSSHYEYPLYIFLVGYCKNCGKGFTQEIPHNMDQYSYGYQEHQLQVNKTGCVPPPEHP